MPRYELSPRKGFRIVELDTVSSTNDYLRLRRGDFHERLTLAVAEWQTAGRGATGRWQSERGANLLFSLLLHPTMLEATDLFLLSQVACLAVCLALRETGGDFSVKWPNDVYIGDRKVAGILIENELRGKRVSDCVVGMGVNVSQREFAPDAPNPTSLALALGREADRSQVLDSILHRFDTLYAKLERGNFDEVREEYLQHLYRRGETRAYRDTAGEFRARLETVEPSGHLVLLDEEGARRRYAFKEVQFII